MKSSPASQWFPALKFRNCPGNLDRVISEIFGLQAPRWLCARDGCPRRKRGGQGIIIPRPSLEKCAQNCARRTEKILR